MRSSRKALEADRRSDAALSLWIASNFRRSDQLGEDEMDPTYGSEMRAPIFYAVASGPEISQLILARANNDMNSRLARHAINALHRTAGGSSLWMSFDRPTPLVDSLSFPERRVRYDAALALGQALPLESFPGSDRVVPILASAIRTGAETFAAVIADNEENRRSLAANLRSMGFTVLPPRGRYEEARADLARTEGLDLFVLMTSPSQLLETVSRVRSDLRLSATPVLAVVSGPELNTVRDMFESDQRLQVIRAGVSEEQMANSILALIRETTGELMTEEEADQYAAESLQTLRDIAVRNTPAFHITDAEAALLDALDEFEGDLRLVAAETLSWIGTADSQQKLLDAALNETDELTQAALLDYVSDSAKRFGAYVEDRQVSRLLELVREGSGVAATAAAQAHGALNLPVSNVTPFIIGEPSSP